MGTNFYLNGYVMEGPHYLPINQINKDEDDPIVHIGKRSAAGMYCWDCGATLCVGGEREIHTAGPRSKFNDCCLVCGNEPVKVNGLKEGPAAVELGFAKPNVKRSTGVRGCSSFSWAQPPKLFLRFAKERVAEHIVRDEYGRKYTGREFLIMLDANCPVQFNCVGNWFC